MTPLCLNCGTKRALWLRYRPDAELARVFCCKRCGYEFGLAAAQRDYLFCDDHGWYPRRNGCEECAEESRHG